MPDNHIPVLLSEVTKCLKPQKGETYLDATAGYGGHASAILERTLQAKGSVLVDRDENAVKALEKRFGDSSVQIIHGDFVSAAEELKSKKQHFDIILADLGVSSPHLDNASRGFSFTNPGPLDMRMDQRQKLSAHSVVNEASEHEIYEILRLYGEEPHAKLIAHAIVTARPIETTDKLATIVAEAIHRPYQKVHPATRTFQAIRIAVNRELELLEKALPIWVSLLKPGGRLAIISFHSLEDRIVKQFFAEHAGDRYDAELRQITKKPIICSKDEAVLNPRARSAKLRAVAKIKKERS